MPEAPPPPYVSPPSAEETESVAELAETRWLKRLVLIFAGFLVIVVLGAASFVYLYLRNSSADVKLELEGPEEVFRGVPFEINVSVENGSDRLISNAEIAVTYSHGIAVFGGADSSSLVTDSVGDMGSGSFTKRTYKFIGTGSALSEEEISFRFSYLGGGRSRFESSKNYRVKIRGNAVEFTVKKPDQVLPGSSFEVEISYKNVSDFDFPETVLEAQYPNSFKYVSASLTPDSLNNLWRLGEVRAGSEGKLEIRGLLQSDGSLAIPLIFSAVFLGEEYPLAETNVDLSLAPPPVEVSVLINRQENYVPRLGDRLNYAIGYRNLSGIALADVVVEVELSSDLFDFASINTNGNWNPASRKITWSAGVSQNLRLLDAGGSGEVSFSVNLKNSFPITRLNDKNFILRANVKVTSPSVPYYLKADVTEAALNLETKVAGIVVVDAQGFYRDADSGILNLGPMPPKAGAPTQYSIHLLIRNYSTDVKDVSVRASLSPGVRWTGAVKSNIDSVPLYDENTNEVVWAIDKIRATKGVLDSPVESVFQIEAIPSPADVGRFQLLLGSTSLRASDEFTGLELLSSDIALNSSLPDDITIGQNGGKVVP
ncbi:MAG: hypothetical protein UY26_C0004G0012 [Candidatus Jorgensenbacteria bacterium GW2011_GWA1_48_13]|uniref:DUF11 domain-containing protein n=1 Tax=Candidatus Jorgensenbacteria bacterium GW2011_GWB1_50_10 TaxID=1618665 RepID=A0A0G1Z755_9BACT|nr:MAG: hypothetical protein UY26_C0004G0012 [Candidatus Jorgensenbacteria bacterium GW2011_GWA1_48_13]KKW14759.1 MAG: hypothetical protein UY55_C0004G0012 [Candidatus Jorgensenbacteria bacterium GW2011_GWB1_50_10]